MRKYAARYFEKTKLISEKFLKDTIVTLQFFQWDDDVVLCGMKECLELLERETDTSKYKIKYLEDGTIIKSRDVVLELEGHYSHFGMLEGIIDGILARASSLATNARNIVNAAKGKKVIYMGDRADHYSLQSFDGYAISVGGINTQVTLAHIEKHNGVAVGTVPHVLIQMFGGDLVKAMHAYKETFPTEKLTALVDFNNDVISDSLLVLKEFGKELDAVRVDTSSGVIDKCFDGDICEKGVSKNLIKELRKALDANDGQHVKIVVSSGFNLDKIKDFEAHNIPVDVYGVGASLLKINRLFSADAVLLNGKEVAKVGRGYRNNPNLIIYKHSSN